MKSEGFYADKNNSTGLPRWKQIGGSPFSAGNYQEIQISMQLNKVLKFLCR